MGRETSRRDLIPGVGGRDTAPPRPVYNSNQQIETERRRAAVRELIDILVLIAVDILYLSWPVARIPFLSREATLWVLLALHVLVVLSWIRTRWYLQWKAKRIAATWSDTERTQFKRG